MKLLVAVDLSDATPRIIEAVKKIASGFDSDVRILHVAEPDPDFVGFEAGPETLRDQIAAEFRDAHETIQQHAEALRGLVASADALLVRGSEVDTIIEESRKFDADLLVLGTHGRSAAFDLIAGSVSQGVIRASRIPVLLIPVR